MSHKLSFSAIAATLAALGAPGLFVACGGEAPAAASPVDGKEVAPATDEAAPGDSAAPADAPADSAAPAGSGAAADAAPAGSAAPAASGGAPAAAPAAAAPVKKKKMGGKKHGSKAGCGAGTCG